MKFLVLQHINIEHPGIFRKFMKEDNVELDTVELDQNEKIPNLDKYDAMIVMGGPMDTWQEETYPWLKVEKENIETDKPQHLNLADEIILKTLIKNHCQYTKSNIANKILNQWDVELENFVKVMPIEYKRALNEMKDIKKKEVA